jgi:hypothetical protein
VSRAGFLWESIQIVLDQRINPLGSRVLFSPLSGISQDRVTIALKCIVSVACSIQLVTGRFFPHLPPLSGKLLLLYYYLGKKSILGLHISSKTFKLIFVFTIR